MNETELRRAEQELRDAVTGSQLAWVLDEVDAAIADGVPEEKVLRRRSQASAAVAVGGLEAEAARYETVSRLAIGDTEYETFRKRGSLVITTRPMSPQERLQLLHSALQRVLIEVPSIEAEALKTLREVPATDADSDRRDAVTSVRFIPDGDTPRRTEREVNLSGTRLRPTEREHLADLFTDAGRESTP
ncbi:hypothetical protein [Embleya sp. NPDC059237]|uniref:hypothetical protein n=1 Tax=Embleya sp. NPDC059237 TaxID=3346784 RepID=UPI0036B38FEB